MSRPTPPMYAKVQRKVPPTGRKTTAVASPPAAPSVAPQPAPPEPVEPAVEEDVDADVEGSDEADEESGEDEESDEDPDGGDPAPLSARQRKKLSKWSEEMSQRNLYALAKEAGLDVRIRDPKDELIKKIKDALG